MCYLFLIFLIKKIFLAGGLCWVFVADFELSLVAETGLLSSCDARASHCCGFSHCGTQALGAQASVVEAHGLSCPTACGILPDQGSNLCLLHWKAAS